MHKEVIGKKSDEVNREYRHKEELQESTFKNLWRIVRRSKDSLEHSTGELSNISQTEREGVYSNHEPNKYECSKKGEDDHLKDKNSSDMRKEKEKKESIN